MLVQILSKFSLLNTHEFSSSFKRELEAVLDCDMLKGYF